MKTCGGEDVLMSIGNINITLRYEESQSNTAVTKECPEEYKGTVLPAKSDSDVLFCLQSYQKLRKTFF